MSLARVQLGSERIGWLGSLARCQKAGKVGLVHASPDDAWRAPGPESTDDEFTIYQALSAPVVVYGHIHRPFVRRISRPQRPEMLVVNSGSVSLSYDGDPRAKYLILDESKPTIRRVEYDVEQEIRALSSFPHCDWLSKSLRMARPSLP
jgi:diadenosine tetraphosphatase ApaH/serine/threonine PP2A family protein phosphatase